VNGKDVPEAASGAPGSVRVVAFSPDGCVPVTVSVPVGADLELAMGCYTLGLEGSPLTGLQPRPAGLTTGVYEVGDAVLVTTVARIPQEGR
jgi:hypothetical protein